MTTIFTVKNEDLERLGPKEAVDFFREMLWAEASALGVAKNLINVPSAITVADGGIDAEVKDAKIKGGQGIIKQGITRYQIKTGDFSLSEDRNIKEILFKDRSSELKPRVKSCLDKGGTFIVVLFGWDNPEVRDNQIVDKFRKQLVRINKSYKNAKIEIFRQNNIIGFLKPYPSLALHVTGHRNLHFQTHHSWSQDAEMMKELKSGDEQFKFIQNLQAELRRDDDAVHIRVYGEAGVGKTKLVLESTRSDDLKPLVLYCDSASKFVDSDLLNEILREDNTWTALVVVDECDSENRARIWNKVKHCGPRIKLITIFNEFDDSLGTTKYVHVPLLERGSISEIIQDYWPLKDQADRWAEFCDGFPRVAHVIGQNLRDTPDDILKSPDTVNVWNRFITGRDNPENEEVKQRKLVLLHLSLFKRFGFGANLKKEAEAIFGKVQKVNPQITWLKFGEIVKELKNRKILQGENTLYITPKLLHIKLWTEWWDIYGEHEPLENFLSEMPPQLVEWFAEMFKYARESQAAAKTVAKLLGEDGIFQNSDYLKTQFGSLFFSALAEADPKAALMCLKRTMGTWTKDDLLQFTTGRREIIYTLEKIAMWKDLFADAARLLLSLGEAENETWANNASGVFAELFSPGTGLVARSQASPEERFPILKEALYSESREKRLIALRACNQALESGGFTRTIGPEYQGLTIVTDLWMPKTWGELFEAYRRVWNLLLESMDSLPQDEQRIAVEVFLRRSRELSRFQNLVDMIINTLRELSTKPFVDKKVVLAEVVQILHYDGKGMLQAQRVKWEALKESLTGSDFPSLLRRYAGMQLLEDRDDKNGEGVDLTQAKIETLVQQVFDDVDLLRPELKWLVTTEAQNGYRFGYVLGYKDKEFLLLPILLEAQRIAGENGSAFFLGGYFRAIFEKDKSMWEKELDILVEDPVLTKWIPELTWRSGLTDQAAQRVFSLVINKRVEFSCFRFFCLGGIVKELSEPVFTEWVEFLFSYPSVQAVFIALDLFHLYYLHANKDIVLPRELAVRLLLHPLLFQETREATYEAMPEYYWTEIAKVIIVRYPEESLSISEKMLECFGKERTIIGRYNSYTNPVLKEIVKLYPGETWMQIIKYLGPPTDARAYSIREWLRGERFPGQEKEESALSFIPLMKIWEWVDEDIEKRAAYLAHFAPRELSREEGKVCLTRELLVRYGGREDVKKELMTNFSTGSFMGPLSFNFQNKKDALLKYYENEDNENVKRWINDFIYYLDKDIEHARVREERGWE